MKNNLSIVKTSDGCDTIFNSEIGEHYHSVNGAYEESMHVFIKNGFQYCKKKHINIFEVGFGTGLNSILTFLEAQKSNVSVNYFAIEKFPVGKNIIEKLNFSDYLNSENLETFHKLHSIEWERSIKISSNFSIHKINSNFVDYEPLFNIDITYFDAFSYEKQPEMWTSENFKKIFQATNNEGILTTYASKGIIKQNLREVGFFVKRLPGINGKRHIVRAIKQ
jgi:tRNA U34 5-methylaminomethyl-2-thiouridine-forming methyltransferase MnmC